MSRSIAEEHIANFVGGNEYEDRLTPAEARTILRGLDAPEDALAYVPAPEGTDPGAFAHFVVSELRNIAS